MNDQPKDDNNIDILIKKRADEIKEAREQVSVEPEEGKVPPKQETPQAPIAKKKAKKKRGALPVITLLLLIVAGVSIGYNFYLRDEIATLKNEMLSLLDHEGSFTFNGETVPEDYFIVEDRRELVHVEFVMKYIDDQVKYSNSKTRVYVPLNDKTYQLESDALTDYVKANIVDINIPLLKVDGKDYLDFTVLRKLYGLDVMIGEDGSFAMYQPSKAKLYEVDGTAEFTKTKSGLNRIGDENNYHAIVLSEHESLSKIITSNGRMGYISTDALKTIDIKEEKLTINTVRESHEYGEHVNMTWSQINGYNNTPDISNDEVIPGLDAISPTSFSLNINGIILNESDFRYISDAKLKGYEVWALFDNDFNPGWTSEMLNDSTYRRRAIAQIAFYASLYDLDGVNIDYENMYLNDKDMFTQFMAELRSVLKEQNIILSVDVTIPGGSDQWSKVYDRANIAKHVDYMMFMAYDEYWASSPVSGPVASIPWVKGGIEQILEIVPNDKLILGMPLYMRVWKESGGNVSSKAIGVKHLDGVIFDKDFNRSFDEKNNLNFIDYKVDGAKYKIWVEDEHSINERIKLMKLYNLPGIGTWSKEFVELETWQFIDETLQNQQ